MGSPLLQQWLGRWEQVRGTVKEFWGWLTDDPLTRLEGTCDRRLGRLHERTGRARAETQHRVLATCRPRAT